VRLRTAVFQKALSRYLYGKWRVIKLREKGDIQ